MQYVAARFFPVENSPGQNMDNIIASKEIQVERKHLVIEYRENSQGRFLRITEEAHGRRNTVIVPSTGLAEFLSSITGVLIEAGEASFVTPAA